MARNIKDFRTLLINFPETLSDEMDTICEENVIGKTEFMQIAIHQLMEYMDNHATVPLLLETSARIEQRRRDLQLAVSIASLKAKEEKLAKQRLAKQKLIEQKMMEKGKAKKNKADGQ